jgi:hypothetical protein
LPNWVILLVFRKGELNIFFGGAHENETPSHTQLLYGGDTDPDTSPMGLPIKTLIQVPIKALI